MKEKMYYSGLVGFCLGMFLTVIFFNVSAHDEIKKNESITLKTYWDGK